MRGPDGPAHDSSAVSGATCAPSADAVTGAGGFVRGILRRAPLLALLAEVSREHLGVLADLFRGAVGDGLAVVEDVDLLAHAHDHLHVVLDEDDGDLELVAEPADLLLEALGLAVVHPGGGLVEEQELGPEHHGPRDLQAALVAVGERGGDLVGHGAEIEDLQQLEGARGHLLLVAEEERGAQQRRAEVSLAPVLAGDQHVLEDGELAEEADVLEGAPDAEDGDLAGLAGHDVGAGEEDAAAGSGL